MKADILRSAGIDYDRGVKRFLGRASIYEKALSKFPNDSCFNRIKAAYDDNDMDQLFAAAHELKGVSGNIALSSLYESVNVLVELLRCGKYSHNELDLAYRQLTEDYEAVYNAVLAAAEVAI